MKVIWLWGRPCSGKTTIAKHLNNYYLNKNKRVILFDGDLARSSNKNKDFSPAGRLKQVYYIQNKLLYNTEDDIAIVALITPYDYMRKSNRNLFYNYYEIFVNTPLDIAIQRDVKGMYEKALKGEIENFTGISDVFDETNTANITCYTENEDIEISVKKIIKGANI